jgi:hypothetical protein
MCPAFGNRQVTMALEPPSNRFAVLGLIVV